MRTTTTRIALLALVLLGTCAGASFASTSIAAGIHVGPSGRASVDLGFFYDDLAPYGHWIERPHFGWVWRPRVAVTTWRPYEYGHWAWTDWGWTWVSDEPFGWATYHYGRWYDDPDYGWEWVPGDQWSPAWVSWQEGNDYVGWAALPPDYSPGVSYDFAASIAPADYCFVPERRFLEPRIVDYVVSPFDEVGIYGRTRNFTNYRVYNNGQIFDQGVPVDRIQQVIGRSVPRYQVADLGWNERHQARIAANQVAMFRPQVARGAQVAPPPARPLARRAVMTAATAAATVGAVHAAHSAWVAHAARVAPDVARRQEQVMARRQQQMGLAATQPQTRWQRQQQRQQVATTQTNQPQTRWQRQQQRQQVATAQPQARWQRQQQRQQLTTTQPQTRWQRQQQRQLATAQPQTRWQRQQQRQQVATAQPQTRWQRQQQRQQVATAQPQARWQRQQQRAMSQPAPQPQARWQRQQQRAMSQPAPQQQPRWQRQQQRAMSQPAPQQQPRWQRQQQRAMSQPAPQQQPRWQRRQAQGQPPPQGNPNGNHPNRRNHGGPGQ